MPRYTITATVAVDVEMSVEAASNEDARKMFNDSICMTASLVDVPAAKFDVSEDSISELNNVRITREKD